MSFFRLLMLAFGYGCAQLALLLAGVAKWLVAAALYLTGGRR